MKELSFEYHTDTLTLMHEFSEALVKHDRLNQFDCGTSTLSFNDHKRFILYLKI